MRRTRTPIPALDMLDQLGATRPYALHKVWNPAGSKLLRAFYKAKKGERGTYGEALRYYAQRQR